MVDAIVETFKSVAQLSDIKRAQILSVSQNADHSEPRVSVQVTWSSRNLSSMERSFTNCDSVVMVENVVFFPPVPVDKNVILSQHSKTGNKSAYIAGSESDKEAQWVMIIERDGSMKSVDLKAADKHGKVYADNEFGGLEWSSDETKLLYVAEKKRPKPKSFVAKVKKDDDEDTRGQEYVFIDEWGEQLEGKHQSVVCILNIETGDVTCHALPDTLCPGQLVWAPNNSGIFGVAFVSTPYRLGLIYCPIRESKLFFMDLEGNYSEISQDSYNIRTPRLSPDGSRIAFLRSTVGGPHAKSAQLCLLSWPEKEERVVVDVIPREKTIEEGYKFMGIYGYSGMPRRCWLNDSKRLVLSTYKFDTVVTYVVNVDSGTITELPHMGSQNVFDVHNDWLLVDFSYICQPSQILLGQVPAEGQERSIKLKEVTPKRNVEGIPNYYHSRWEFINDIPHPDPKYSNIPISVIYFGPTILEAGAAKRPLICWPHGGPHSTLTNVFVTSAAFFVKLGYSIIFPNYRGSLGFGEDGVNALPGYCGTVDVSDVHQATLSCLQRFSDVLDPDQVFLFGGSHGGFLVTHLAAQHPETYKVVSARNPVTDISAMANVTDIPDWCFVETGYSFKHGDIPNAEILSKMYQMSPISHIDKLKAPTLLLIGKNDRRVSPYNGIHYHKMLLARGVETELHLYEDCHPLSKVNVEFDSLIHTALWFEKHRQRS
ncbi:hypothetical protein SK128_005235 [Halocaridina rubra]|uniref:Acylamino-acid-releasing enzyme n=1 Tax=Halocaridina rubra TaxID=373956 RepID=A0AAN8WPS1_HALRR